ncbi:MAG TPA: hypothetical protein VF384_14810 [Planctomycetota bacterium]
MSPTRTGAQPSAPSWVTPHPLRSPLVIAVVAALALVAIAGAASLAFLCDDAYIHFRYAANLHAGHGLVWNAPPFHPVEGAGFLWPLILCFLWICFGLEPPDAANPFSILCGALQVVVLAFAALRLCRRDGTRVPAIVGLLALCAIVGNRTFLQWMTGGLDTALFNLPFLAWVVHAFRTRERRHSWLTWWSSFAALAALTRPDGLTLVCATLGTAALSVLRKQALWRPTLIGLWPLLAVVAQVLWRRAFYGEWLPNTYYAKVVGAWPEAGLRYFACFAIENGAWLWFPVAAAWLGVECRRAGLSGIGPLVANTVRGHLPAVAATLITLFNAGYYLIAVGGDHFEYRVLSQLVPLGVLACVAMGARMSDRTRVPIAIAVGLAVASSVGWLHLALTRELPSHGQKPIAPQLPAVVRPLARWYDHQQAWLSFRFIGLRCNYQADLLQNFSLLFGTQRQPIANPPDPFPIIAGGAVGLLGWTLPDCAVIDVLGLNDWVVARTPTTPGAPVSRERMHEACAAADRDQDGSLDAAEVRTAMSQAFQTVPTDTSGDFIIEILVSVLGDERGRIAVADSDAIVDLLGDRRMAHERKPPPGYVEAFDANVTVSNGIVTARPRKEPMTAERLRAIETEWMQKIRDQKAR